MTFTTLSLQARRRKQIAWLRAQPEFPLLLGADQDMTDAGRELLQRVAVRMTAAGIIGVEKHRPELRVQRIRALITQARRVE